MLSFPEGAPFVPPTCPSEKSGSIPDLSQADFRLEVREATLRPSRPTTEVWGVFGTIGDDDETSSIWVETATVKMPLDSVLVRSAFRIAGLEENAPPSEFISAGIPSTQSPAVERLRTNLCERVANCRGIINGECWALGRAALQEALKPDFFGDE